MEEIVMDTNQMPEGQAAETAVQTETEIPVDKIQQTAADQQTDTGEDLLLEQIDAFRDKAKQLQNLISAKERKVKELEALVRAKEEKNQQLQEQNQRLQEELGRKKAQADGLVADVEQQMGCMLQAVQGDMAQIEQRVQEQVAQNQEEAKEQTRETRGVLEQVRGELSAVRTDVEAAKGELSEKVHSENVKVYRNVQDLLKEMDHSEEQEERSAKKFRSLQVGVNVATVLTVVNLVAVSAALFILFGML